MSAEKLSELANADTPSAIHVPNSLAGVFIWAIGRFGIGIAVAAIALFALDRVYDDMKQMSAQVLRIAEVQGAMVQSNTQAMERLIASVERLVREAESAHRITSK